MRKQKEIILQENGRNLTFIIEQMPATKMQLWLLKALSLLCGTELASMDFGVLQKEFKTKGFALLQGLDIAKAEPLSGQFPGADELGQYRQRNCGRAHAFHSAKGNSHSQF